MYSTQIWKRNVQVLSKTQLTKLTLQQQKAANHSRNVIMS